MSTFYSSSQRLCNTCQHWARESLHPAANKKGQPEPYLVGACNLVMWRDNLMEFTRGSHTCIDWKRVEQDEIDVVMI